MATDKDWKPALNRSQLHLILLVDCSGSMSGEKIQQLNCACHEVAEALRDADAENVHANVLVRAIAFSNGARWQIGTPMPAANFTWTDLGAAGGTDLGAAFDLLAPELSAEKMGKRNKPPIFVLLSDGGPTDDWRPALERLNATPWGKAGRAMRVAVAIGREADESVLAAFTGNQEMVWKAANAQQLKDRLQLATVTLTSQVSGGSVTPGDPGNVVGPGPVAAGNDPADVW